MTPKPIYSKPWYGRRFKLDENALTWGRFSVDDPQYSKLSADAKSAGHSRFREVNPQLIADAFEHLLSLQKPDSLSNFCSEVQVLAVYEFSKQSLTSPHQVELPEGHGSVATSVSESLGAALMAVLRSAWPVRAEGIEFVGYAPTLAAPYTATLRSDEGYYYDAVFDSELVLKQVQKRGEVQQVWPPLKMCHGQSALVANLL